MKYCFLVCLFITTAFSQHSETISSFSETGTVAFNDRPSAGERFFSDNDFDVSASPLFNQDSTADTSNHAQPLKWYTMLQRIPGDWNTVWKISISKSMLPTIGVITGLTLVMVVADQPLEDYATHAYFHNQTIRNFSDFFEYVGDGRPQFGLSAAFAVGGFLTHSDRALRTASQMTEAILACGAVIQVMKHLTGRESPFVSTERNGRWDLFPNQIDYANKVPHYDAFPSGHIATTMTTLTVLLENYPETKPWLQPISYVIVGAVGAALCTTGIHWWSDFPLGVYLGYQFGMVAAHPEITGDSKPAENESSGLTFSPSISSMGEAITLSYHF